MVSSLTRRSFAGLAAAFAWSATRTTGHAELGLSYPTPNPGEWALFRERFMTPVAASSIPATAVPRIPRARAGRC
ncbi:hypothetical protein ACFQU7_07890 [Pseudoroseomonas wenyumeiae]